MERSTPSSTSRIAISAVAVYYVSSACAFAGAWYGWQYVRPPQGAIHRPADEQFLDALTHWDGRWYLQIARDGYAWQPHSQTNVAFFPVYPLLSRWTSHALGIDLRLALVLVANVAFLAALAVLIRSAQDQMADCDSPVTKAIWPAVALAAWPVSVFYRVAYSEGVFLLFAAIVLHGMRRRWHPAAVAVCCGALTGCRSTGVAMLPSVMLYLWQQRPHEGRKRYFASCVAWLVLSAWGLIAFMLFQWHRFGNPLAFSETQAGWRNRPPHGSFAGWLWSAVSLEPLRGVFDPTCVCFWNRDAPHGDPIFNVSFWNPIVFFATGATVLWGWKKGTVSLGELLFAATALAIPYFLHAYTHCFMSGARFSVIVIPFFFVVGRWLEALPPPAAALLVGVGMVGLFALSSGFAADYWVF
jgi:hypothetical protein